MPTVAAELSIDALPAQSWAAVTDVENYPQCMDNVRSVEIVECSGADHRTTAWSVWLRGPVLEWVAAEYLDHQARRCDFRQISGDLSRFVGYWSVRPAGDSASLVSLHLEFDIGIPLLADMLNPVAAAALRENAQQMLTALERRLTDSR